MTKFNHKKASEQIARIYDIGASVYFVNQDNKPYLLDDYFITQDLGTLTGLAVRNGIGYLVLEDCIAASYAYENEQVIGSKYIEEYYKDHSNDPEAALCVAFAKALIKKGVE